MTTEPATGDAALPEQAPATLGQQVEYAKLLADSGLIPKTYQRQPANVLAAIQYGQALGLDPIVAMNHITVVNGGVSMDAQLMLTLARKAGHTVRLDGDANQATCTIVRADDPDHEQTATWTADLAKQAGLWGNGHWKKNPALMLKYRAATECIRLACPEVLAGITYTPEELKERRGLAVQTTVHQVRADDTKTAADYMKTLGLTGKTFAAFAHRVLPDTQFTRWQDLDAPAQQRVLDAAATWAATGTDPTSAETVTAEIINPETGEITEGEQE